MNSKRSHALQAGRTIAAKEGVPTSHKVVLGVLAAVWWISPVDDVVIPTWIFDEAFLTVAAIHPHVVSVKNWYRTRKQAKQIEQ